MPLKGRKLSEEHKRRIGEANKIALLGHIPWNKGSKGVMKSNKTSFKKGSTKLRNAYSFPCGPLHPNWKNNASIVARGIRASLEYEEWRKACMERDDYTCLSCGEVGGRLEVDHIKPFSLYPDLRLELSNGRTLCKDCHKRLGWSFFKNANPRKNPFKQIDGSE